MDNEFFLSVDYLATAQSIKRISEVFDYGTGETSQGLLYGGMFQMTQARKAYSGGDGDG